MVAHGEDSGDDDELVVTAPRQPKRTLSIQPDAPLVDNAPVAISSRAPTPHSTHEQRRRLSSAGLLGAGAVGVGSVGSPARRDSSSPGVFAGAPQLEDVVRENAKDLIR